MHNTYMQMHNFRICIMEPSPLTYKGQGSMLAMLYEVMYPLGNLLWLWSSKGRARSVCDVKGSLKNVY